jgi:hypothetical protein
MKIIKIFLALLLVVLGSVYVFVFTSLGNEFLKPIVESKIQEQTKLNSKLEIFSLGMSNLEIKLVLNKNNTIHLKGDYSLFSQAVDITYSVEFKDLKTLKSLTQTQLNGTLHANGSLKGDKTFLTIDGKSDIASSDTSFSLIMKDLKPSSIVANITNLKLQELLPILKQPHYTDGVFWMKADITNLDIKNLQGDINASIKNALLNSKYMTQKYEFKSAMPRTIFNLQTVTKLNSSIIDSKVNLNSNIANLDIKSVKYYMKDSSFTSDFITIIPNLDKFFFLTNQRMRGAITINGDIKKAKDLDLNVYTKFAGGNIDAKVHNNDLKATINKLDTLELLKTLDYPEVFKANLNAELNYNLAKSKGRIDGHLVDGKFTENKLFNLLKEHSKLDLYKENFTGDINALLNKEKIITSFNLKSQQASIKTKNTKFNTKTQIIDSRIDLNINKDEIGANIKGDIKKPKVKLDIIDVIKNRVEKEIKKLFKKFF